MTVSRGFLRAALIAVGVVLTTTSWADDLEPASYRGEPNSVMAKADLTMSPPTLVLTEGANPTFPLSTVPEEIFGPVTSGNVLTYQLTLPNYIDTLPLKMMRVQFSWFGSNGDAVVPGINVIPNMGGSIQLVNSTLPVPVPGVANAFHRYDDFELRPNPDVEVLQIDFIDADPRWLIVDTISIPEPSTGFLMGPFGMMLAVGCCRRRRQLS